MMSQFKHFVPLLLLSLFSVFFMSWTINRIGGGLHTPRTHKVSVLSPVKNSKLTAAFIYDSLELETKGLSQNAFNYAMKGFEKLDSGGVLRNDSVLAIIDFDQPSYKKRLYIIDLKHYKILFNTLVAHGKNTGKEQAEFFSNRNNSHQSSLGFYITDHTYYGSKGYSLKLIGLEKNVNSNAYRRAIVIHGAPYVSQSYIDAQGYIGRSFGCPAIPMAVTRNIIQTIRDGTCLFIYNKSYRPSSDFALG
ncbi:murein L,D-transpeptidase catalytic domain family protein [Niabella terrae]